LQTNIYVINLTRRPDRWKEINNHLKSDLTRIEAIDYLNTELSSHNLSSDAAAACWLSHQLAWNTMISCGDEYSLILEDDAELHHAFKLGDILPATTKFMSAHGVELLQVGFFQDLGRKRNLLKKLGLYRERPPLSILNFLEGSLPDRHGIGTHAYVISRSGANKLSQVNNPVYLAADAALMYLAASQSRVSKISIWQIPVSIFSQRPVSGFNPSDIQ